MPSAKDVEIDTTFLKVFVVGDSGTGKSVFASTFPTPAFLFNFDKSILTYRGLDIDYEDFELSPKGWIQFEKVLREVKAGFKDGTSKYKTVILDSTTSWTDVAMERAMQLDPKRSATNGPIWNVHYGMVKNLIEGYVRQLLELPCNLVVIGHLAKNIDSESGAIIGVEPLLTGQLSTKVPGYFDEVYYSTTKSVGGKTEFLLLTLARGHNKARSRLSGVQQLLPQEVKNDYRELMKFLQNKK